MATKEQKKAEKQIKQAEKQQVRQLQAAQKAEVKFLKAEGATKQEIKAEQQANKAELKDAKGILKPTGLQFIPQRRDDGFILSNVGTYQDTYAPAIQPKLEQAIGLLSELKVPQLDVRKSGDSTIRTGMSLNNAYAIADARNSGQPITADLLKSQYGNYVTGAARQAKIFDATSKFVNDDAITAEDFSKKLKPVKGQEGLFTSKIGGGTTGVFRLNPETQTYEYLSGTPVKVTTDGGGFFSSGLGSLLVGIGGSLLIPGLGGLLATGTWGGLAGAGATLGSSLAAGGLVGGLGSAITGNDILTGALLGAAGGGAGFKIGQVGGLGNAIKNAGINISDDLAGTLNTLVSGFGAPSAEAAETAANLLTNNGIPTRPQDITAAVTSAVDDVRAPVGSLLDEGLTTGGGGGFKLGANQIEGFLPTPTGGGTLPAIPTPVPGSTGGIGFNPNAGGIGFQVNPEDFLPTPVGGGTLPRPSGVNANIDQFIPQPVGVSRFPELFDERVPTPAPSGGLLEGIGLSDILTAAGVVGALGGAGAPTTSGGGAGKPPTLAPDINLGIPGIGNFPGGTGGIDWNAFMDLYRRGGLGAGQYLGYDLARMLGDIPAQTLLGTPTLGGQIGQASMGQASLV